MNEHWSTYWKEVRTYTWGIYLGAWLMAIVWTISNREWSVLVLLAILFPAPPPKVQAAYRARAAAKRMHMRGGTGA